MEKILAALLIIFLCAGSAWALTTDELLQLKPVSLYAGLFIPAMLISDQPATPSWERSTWNSDSSGELSCHARLIWVSDAVGALKFEGEHGAVVALATSL